MSTPLAQGPRYRAVQCLAPLDPLPVGEPEHRLETLLSWLETLTTCVAGNDVLKLFLAPASFLVAGSKPLSALRHHALCLNLREAFAVPTYRHWLLAPGSWHYEQPPRRVQGASLFLGGTQISAHVLQQRSPRAKVRWHSAGASVPKEPASHPAHRVDDFRPETGLRLGLEIADDHRDGLLWSAFRDAPEAWPDLQLVTDASECLRDGQHHIHANTCAVRDGGLIFTAGISAQRPTSATPCAQLLRHEGRGLFAPVLPELLLTVCGAVARFPEQSL